MNPELIDNSLNEVPDHHPLHTALVWWEKKRLWYNLIVGISGAVPIILFATAFGLGDLKMLILYAFAANVFYSLGFLLEALNHYYLSNRINFQYIRLPLFIIGCILSALLTLLLQIEYYLSIARF